MNKEIKAVEMVRQIRDEQQKMLAGKSMDEVRAFYHKRASRLNARIKKILEESDSKPML